MTMTSTSIRTTLAFTCVFFHLISQVPYVAFKAVSIRCLSCRGTTDPKLCSTVSTCPAGDICGIQKFNTSTGDVIYNVACVSEQACNINFSSSATTSAYPHDLCNHCCNGTICNVGGCGSQGYAAERGPICFSCNRMTNPADCQNIVQCRKQEFCAVFLEDLFGTTLYSSRCIPEIECQQSSVTEVGKRQIKRKTEKICPNCCQQDLCNFECGETTVNVSFTSTTSIPPTLASNATTTASPGPTYFPVTGSSGYEFIVQILTEMLPSHVNIPQILIDATSNGVYSLDGPGFEDYTGNFTKGLNTLNLSSTDLSTQGTENKTIYINSSVPISVFSMNFEERASDMSLIFPLEICSTRYIVPSYVPIYGSLFGISAVDSDTNVTIILRISRGSIKFNGVSYKNGDTLNVLLQRLQTFTLSHYYDLSGTRIYSSNPVCVKSGTECSYVGYMGCSRLEEMVLPVEQFANEFIVPLIYTRNGVIARVMNYENPSTFEVTIEDEKQSKILSPYSFTDINVKGKPFSIRSNDSVLVTMYTTSRNADPFMSLVPGTDQYLSSYNFAVPDLGFTSYITVVVPADDSSGVRLDSSPLSPLTNITTTVSTNTTLYDVLFASVTPGTHVVNHVNGTKFAVFVYGNEAADGYGYLAGMAFYATD